MDRVAEEYTNKLPESHQATPIILHNSSTLHGHQHGKLKYDVGL
jgi:hypothetical protein